MSHIFKQRLVKEIQQKQQIKDLVVNDLYWDDVYSQYYDGYTNTETALLQKTVAEIQKRFQR